MLKTNHDDLPKLLVQGEVRHSKSSQTYRHTTDGEPMILPATGGITYNAKIGDRCVGWAADHLEPGVTTRNSDEAFNAAYSSLSCIGNEAIVRTGDAKGARGFVTGKHGGCEHLICYFSDEAMENMSIGDKIDVRSQGQGMKLIDYPQILLRNMSPELLEKMNITEENGKLKVGVAKIVPAAIMGSGLGSATSYFGDYDITLHDEAITKEYHLDELRFGDIVAIIDADTRFGRTYRTGSVTIGVIIHSDCILAGHGPGVTTLMTCKTPEIIPVIDENANLAHYFLDK
ncbi:DUF4438 domain-containing protein [Acidaminobacterium chupaoyuni]